MRRDASMQLMPTTEKHKRVLIVEDEIAVAFDLEGRLREAGYETVGPAVTPEDAKTLITLGTIDCAVLDVGMLRHAKDDILGSLIRKDVPFLYLTGYGSYELPVELPPAVTLLKPSHLPDLIAGVRKMIEAAEAK